MFIHGGLKGLLFSLRGPESQIVGRFGCVTPFKVFMSYVLYVG